MNKQVPGVLWVAVIACGLMAFGKIMAVFAGQQPLALIDAAITGLLAYGLYRGHKWAFIAVLLFAGLGVGKALTRGGAHAFVILILDGIVVLPVLFSWQFFFPGAGPVSEGE